MAEQEVAVKFTAVGADTFVRAAGSVKSSLGNLNTGVDSFIGATRGAVSEVSGFVTNILLMPQALINTAKTIKAFAETIQSIVIGFAASTDKIVDVSLALNRLTGSIGNTTKLLGKLRAATDGQVGDFELMQIAAKNLGSQFKFSDQDLAILLKGIKASTEAAGEEFSPAVNRLSIALRTGRISLIGSITGFDGLRGAIKAHKDELERSRTVLTAQAEKLFLQQKIVELARGAYEKFGSTTETASDIAVRFETAIGNLTTSFQIAFGSSERLKRTFEFLDNIFKGLFGSTTNLGTALGDKLASGLASVVETAVRSLPDLIGLFNQLLTIGGFLIQDVFPGLLKGISAIGAAGRAAQKAGLVLDIAELKLKQDLLSIAGDDTGVVQKNKEIKAANDQISAIEALEFAENARVKAITDGAVAYGNALVAFQGKVRGLQLDLEKQIKLADELREKADQLTQIAERTQAGALRGELRPTLEVLLNISFDETDIERKAAEAKAKIEQEMKARAAAQKANLDAIFAFSNIFLPETSPI